MHKLKTPSSYNVRPRRRQRMQRIEGSAERRRFGSVREGRFSVEENSNE